MKALNLNLSNMTLRRVLALGALVALVGLGTHPTFQWLVHTFLIHGLALDPTSWLLSALWLTLSGWSVELSFRATPWLGALPLRISPWVLFFLGYERSSLRLPMQLTFFNLSGLTEYTYWDICF